jgi:hypothetical protein
LLERISFGVMAIAFAKDSAVMLEGMREKGIIGFLVGFSIAAGKPCQVILENFKVILCHTLLKGLSGLRKLLLAP